MTGAEIGRALDTTAYRTPSTSLPIGSTSIAEGDGTVSDLKAAAARRRALSASPPEYASTRDCLPAWTNTTVLCASHPSKSAVAPSRASNAGSTAASTIRLISASSPSTWTPT